MLLGIVGLAIAAVASVDDVRDQALPGVAALAAAFGLQLLAMIASARAWVCLFPPTADRHLLARGLYTSQLTKYLPAGGFVQAASQVTMSTADGEGLGRAAIRLPVFSLCTLVAAALWSSLLVFDTDLPGWARLLAGAALGSVALVHRRVLRRRAHRRRGAWSPGCPTRRRCRHSARSCGARASRPSTSPPTAARSRSCWATSPTSAPCGPPRRSARRGRSATSRCPSRLGSASARW